MTPYDKLLARKRTWTPVQTTAGKLVEGAEETIYRALALRHMELPVGDFINDALKNEVPKASVDLLRSNIKARDQRPMISPCVWPRRLQANAELL